MCSVKQQVITGNCTAVKLAVRREPQRHSSRTIMWLESHSCTHSWEDTFIHLEKSKLT